MTVVFHLLSASCDQGSVGGIYGRNGSSGQQHCGSPL